MGSDETAGGPPAPDALGGLPSDAVRDELERIIVHPEFHATDNMRAFLRFVVEETLAGRSNQLKGYTIATAVFGRGKGFDAAQDPIVRIQAGRLRRALERYYLVAGGRDPVYIDIPKGGYVPHFSRQGVESEAIRDRASAPDGAELPPLVGPSVAVGPLDNLTGDPDQLFFTVGLAEELTTALSRFQDLVVISGQRAPQGAGRPAEPGDLDQPGGARFVLRGTVRRDTERVKVSLHLTDTRIDRQVWAEAFAQPLDAGRLIAWQEEIAHKVVGVIASEYGIIARRLSSESRQKAPAELSTYEAVLRYHSYQANPSLEASEACFTALQRAAEREAEYGPVQSALAGFLCEMYSYDAPGFDRPLETALDYARRGVSLDPGSQLARFMLAYALSLSGDIRGFRQEVETALALNPGSSSFVGSAGHCYYMVGDFERGRSLMDRAIAANPYHPSWFHLVHVFDRFRRREYERAFLEFEKHRPVADFWNLVLSIALLGKLDRAHEARAQIEELEKVKPDFASRARELFSRSVKVDALVDELIDGLKRAGLPVEER